MAQTTHILKALHAHGEPTQVTLIILADYTSSQDHMGMWSVLDLHLLHSQCITLDPHTKLRP